MSIFSKHPILTAAAALAVAAGSLLGATFIGYEISHRELGPSEFFGKVDRKIEPIFFNSIPEKLEDETYVSSLLLLNSQVDAVELDIDRPSGETNLMTFTGGGMTSFGDDLLLLPYDGNVYKAQPGVAAQLTGIKAPQTNRAAYVTMSLQPENQDVWHAVHYIRYNDVKYFKNDAGQGLLASFTEYHEEDQCATNTLARLDFPANASSVDEITAEPEDWQIVYRSSPCLGLKKRMASLESHMAGGRMVLTDGETAYLANGDYHMDGMRSDGLGIAQDPNHELGKVMRINFMTGESEMVSMGHRNMQGVAALPDGTVFVAEHGPRGGDELNRIIDGANYGWPKESYGTTYANGKLPESEFIGRHDKFMPPEFAWMPSPAISSMVYVDDGFHDNWTGDLLVGSLVTESLFRVRLGNGKPVYSEQIEIGSRIRALWQHTNGQLVLWTDNHELIWLSGEEAGGYDKVLDEFVWRQNISDGNANKLAAVVERCAECHSFVMSDHERSPGLARIYGDKIASTSYEFYSDGLKGRSGVWDDETLKAYISDPQAFAPGSSMPVVVENDERLVELVVDFLRHHDNKF